MVSFPMYAVSLMKCFIETLSCQAIKDLTTFPTNLTWEDCGEEKMRERGRLVCGLGAGFLGS